MAHIFSHFNKVSKLLYPLRLCFGPQQNEEKSRFREIEPIKGEKNFGDCRKRRILYLIRLSKDSALLPVLIILLSFTYMYTFNWDTRRMFDLA